MTKTLVTDPRLGALALGLVVIAALLDFAHSLNGDQSLFLTGAHSIRDAAVLYRDFSGHQAIRDLRFFLATAFGAYSASNIHAFELFYMLLFGVALFSAARRSWTFAAVAALIPIRLSRHIMWV
jgi:hypothetical protein